MLGVDSTSKPTTPAASRKAVAVLGDESLVASVACTASAFSDGIESDTVIRTEAASTLTLTSFSSMAEAVANALAMRPRRAGVKSATSPEAVNLTRTLDRGDGLAVELAVELAVGSAVGLAVGGCGIGGDTGGIGTLQLLIESGVCPAGHPIGGTRRTGMVSQYRQTTSFKNLSFEERGVEVQSTSPPGRGVSKRVV